MRRCLALAALMVLAPAAGAEAATVRVAAGTPPEFLGYSTYNRDTEIVRYEAGRGEHNRLLVSYAADAESVTVTDPAARIEAGRSCTSIDEHRARCVAPPGSSNSNLQHTIARLRDLDDEVRTFRSTPYPIGGVVAFGGAGDDLLDGGAGPDELHGGGGHDRLLGGTYEDVLTDGDRSGARGRARPDSDFMDGGVDHDLVTYHHRKRRVTIDLAAETGGERGERDTVRNLENATGGSGPDRLYGTDEGEVLRGLRGADLLLGRDGADELRGSTGRDRLLGGGGDHLVPGPRRDSISCGRGPDVVHEATVGELLRRRCELAVFSEVFGGRDVGSIELAPYPSRVSRRAAVFSIGCPVLADDYGEMRPCDGTLELRRRGRLLGTGTIDRENVSIDPRVRVRLTPLGRRLTVRRRGVVVNASVAGVGPLVRWTFRLRRGG
jgi:Ca2+-binding RTX toxin-like protein